MLKGVRGDRIGSLAALASASVVGQALAHLGAVTMPFQIGAMIRTTGASATAAGTFGMLQLTAVAVGMMLAAPVFRVLPLVWLALLGTGVAALASFAMYLLPASFVGLSLLGILAGAGYGVVFAVTIAAASANPNADRIYAIGNAGALVLVVMLMSLIPLFLNSHGPLGVFLGTGLVVLAMMPFVLGFSGARAGRTVTARAPLSAAGFALIVTWFLYSLGTGAAWSFSERLGAPLFEHPENIGYVMAAGMAIGVLAAVAAGFTGRYIGRTRAIALGLVGSGLGVLLFCLATEASVFAIGVLLYWPATMFLYVQLLAASADIDSSGRLGALAGGCDRFGFALGAPVGGFVMDHAGGSAIAALAFFCCVSAIPLWLPTIRRTLAEHRPAFQ